MVFEAIVQEKFYILTHPTTTKRGVHLRMEDILQERMPTDAYQVTQCVARPDND
jgi:hypothetical protein